MDATSSSRSPDQRALLGIFHGPLPLCIALFDRELRLVHCNLPWAESFERKAGWSLSQLAGGVSLIELVPALAPVVERVLAGETVQLDGQRVTTDAGEGFWDITLAPLIEDGAITGILGVAQEATERVQAHDLLEQRVAERTRELETLLEVSRSVASTLELDPLLDVIFDQLRLVVDYDSATILLLETVDDSGSETTILRPIASRLAAETMWIPNVPGKHGPITRLSRLWECLQRREPIIIGDVRGDEPLAADFRVGVGDRLDTVMIHVCSLLGIPLAVKERLIGMLAMTSPERNFYTRRHAELATAMANHAALAIENVRLHERSRALAVLEERQRMARELHDSVSQALFGIGLGAETALALLERDPAQVADSLRYVRELANTGLAEMRALIFELRPESLEQEGLIQAVEKQAAALSARYHVAVKTDLGTEPAAPLPVKEALFRIAQEALHNAVKHANPSMIRLQLERRAGAIHLDVSDDGTGFDATASFPGHLGLKSMPERAQQLGGQFTITSTPGAGTRVHASIPIS
jgi:signal transduction histidine kinase